MYILYRFILYVGQHLEDEGLVENRVEVVLLGFGLLVAALVLGLQPRLQQVHLRVRVRRAKVVLHGESLDR